MVVMGMEKVLQSIKEAEQAAEKTLADAQSESSRIISDARRDAAELVAQATTDAQSSVQSTLCLLYTSPSPRDLSTSRMPSSA